MGNRIPIISFFSGGGFLDMGFEMADFEIVWSNEIDKDFAKFYSEGLTSWSGKNHCISKVGSIDEVETRDIINDVQSKIENKIFGVIGGPPCQDFSFRGKRAGFNGKRGDLLWSFYNKILELNPSFFVMENVPGLVHVKKSEGEFRSILELFSEEYFIFKKLLNALDFGVPQSRNRVFVIGINKSWKNDFFADTIDELWPIPLFSNAIERYAWPNAINNALLFEKPLAPKELCVESCLVEIGDIPNSSEYFKILNKEKTEAIHEGDTTRPSFKRLHRKKFSPTACYGNNEVHLHPTENRRLSVRETLRIQGVPDNYILITEGKLTKKFKMIGNGVPVPLAHAVAFSLKQFIRRKLLNGHLVERET